MSFPNQHKETGGNENAVATEKAPTLTCAGPTRSPTRTVPYISLTRGLSRKAALGSLAAWHKLGLTLAGRDKMTKVLQYLSRLLAWWTASHQWRQAQQTLTLSRKAFRLGRGIGETENLGRMIWDVCGGGGHVLRTIYKTGLWGFWMQDNLAFLHVLGGAKTEAAAWGRGAIRSYWISALAGLVVNWRAYWEHRTNVLGPLCKEEGNELALQAAEQKQFSLLVALVKSVCDVLVHSNNAGVDLWKRLRGRKMNEGVHCLLGLVSASTVLYNNYPEHNYTP